MSEPHPHKLGTGLVYTDTIPFSWRELGAWPAGAAAASIAYGSQQVLRLVLSLEEQSPEPSGDAEPEHEDIARLELKLNLLIDLVGQLLAQSALIPPPVTVSMSATGLEWSGATAPQPGACVELALYPSPRYPRPVVLPGFVDAVEPVAGGFRTRVIFPELGAPLQDALERFIFRHHRRTIAHRRETGDEDPAG